MNSITASQASEQASQSIVQLFGYNVNAYALIIASLFVLFLFAIWRAHKANRVDWLDMITTVDQATGVEKVSTTKVLQLIGGITGTFIVVKLTLQNAINWDIFAIYLSYVASIDGFSKLLLAKYGVSQTALPVEPPIVQPTPVNVNVDMTAVNGSAKPKDID
jgi:hypothetical protein